MTRMDQNSFERVVALIEDNPVFSNSSTYSRRPIWFQLAVALDRFGNYGTGASLNRSKRLWGIGKGTVDDYTGRVVLALNQLSARFVRWPSAAERRKISRQMASMGFRGCVGFIDGTTIPLAQKPADDGECFFDRKQCYSLNAQVVCDPRRRIISFLSGWPGSCSDSTIYQQMSLSKNTLKHRFFSNGEYLLADSAYPADLRHNTVIPAYKSNVRGSDIEDFNTCVAHARVIKYSTSSITLLPRV
ncbi:hypothetical protein L915_18106 [Phytophthora nicotianae]|uniref:DDE Tnp4 domain-containing protein n=1 Tax=Phytophthora nicotianae TaxID=4792 RepID=W2FWR5_PHYNI|nr:hypothetical protein L915_18106 [Phytophthora nicotianae]